MEIWKFLLYGITGDLAKKKVLPALAEFAELNQEKVHIELIGYSRSQANSQEISKILNDNTTTGSHLLSKISYIQADYGDSKVFFDIIGNLKNEERFITYLAIPPELFVKILQNSCPFSANPIDLIIEKPFGRSKSEAKQILDIISACNLKTRVHFCDHYMFKTVAQIDKREVTNFKDVLNKQLKKVELLALEKVDVKERKGYYENAGALEDFFIHLFSLLRLSLSVFYTEPKLGDYKKFKVKNVDLGQYDSYITDLDLESSDTNTFFSVDGSLKIESHTVNISFKSGKMLGEKLTEIKMYFTDDTVIFWNLYPDKTLKLVSGGNEISLNLEKNKKLDHTNLFEDILSQNNSRFINIDDVLASWDMYDVIETFVKLNAIKTKKYRNHSWPVVYFD